MAEDRADPRERERRSEKVKLQTLEEGTKLRLKGDITAEVISNPRDGVWVIVRHLSSGEDPSQGGDEEMAFVEDVLEVLDEP